MGEKNHYEHKNSLFGFSGLQKHLYYLGKHFSSKGIDINNRNNNNNS